MRMSNAIKTYFIYQESVLDSVLKNTTSTPYIFVTKNFRYVQWTYKSICCFRNIVTKIIPNETQHAHMSPLFQRTGTLKCRIIPIYGFALDANPQWNGSYASMKWTQWNGSYASQKNIRQNSPDSNKLCIKFWKKYYIFGFCIYKLAHLFYMFYTAPFPCFTVSAGHLFKFPLDRYFYS